MSHINFVDCITFVCGVFAVVGIVGFIYESWRPPLTPIKNSEISEKLESTPAEHALRSFDFAADDE